jgi:hypothetical protein
VTATRRERVYEQLVNEFQGDKTKFFAYFTTSVESGVLRPYRRIAEAIPQMQKDIEAEKALPRYMDDEGSFSASLWELQWSERNRWEIWRDLGKERYS